MIIAAKDDIFSANSIAIQERTLAAPENEYILNQQKRLINQSIQGSAEAFKELITSYQSRIFNLCLRLTGDYNEALDLSQDVLLKIYLKLKTFRHQSSFMTWIYRLTINTAKNRFHWWRRRKKDRTIPLDSISEISAKPALETPESMLLRKELKAKIQEGINRLSFHYRSVIVLRDIEMFSYDEITQILHISQGTVKSRLSRARNILRGYLQEYLLKGI